MSVFEVHREELEKHEMMLGSTRGRLAVGLDLLTNALVLLGQHGVYCRSKLEPGQPVMDLRLISRDIVHVKELVQDVMEELRREREAQRQPD